MFSYKTYYKAENDKTTACIAQSGEETVGEVRIVNQSMYVDKKAIRCAIIKDIKITDEKERDAIFACLLEKVLEKTKEDKYRYVCLALGTEEFEVSDKWISLPINRKHCDISGLTISDDEYNSHYMRKIDYDNDLPMLEAMHNGYAGQVEFMPVRKTPEYWKGILKKSYKGNAFVLCNSNNMPISLMCNDYEADKLVVQEYIALAGYKNAFDISLYKWLEKKGVNSTVVDMYENVETNLDVIDRTKGKRVLFYVTECFGDEAARKEERKRLVAIAEKNSACFHYIEM